MLINEASRYDDARMIERYSTPAMEAIWSRQAKYEHWLQVELAICRAHASEGIVPAWEMTQIEAKAGFDLHRCDELEKETKHDLMAFVKCVSERIGPAGRFFHFGVTSYDVIDTALGLMLRESCDVLIQSSEKLASQIERLVNQYAPTPMIGRTHGVHAEPITFGFKCAGWHAELVRNIHRLRQVRTEVAVCKISGAVGVYGVASPSVEAKVSELLNLKADTFSTQIINRDRHAHFLNTVALLGSGLERIATELRNLQRTEIREVQEAFTAGQTGSSAMPHKRNPWNSETVCGLARLLRANAHAMLETVATWHERDLTNSSLERVILPDSCHVADFMLNRLNQILDGLQVFPENMLKNLRIMGDLVFSEHLMVALIGKGITREAAYGIAQRCAEKAWAGEDFRKVVEEDPEVSKLLSSEQLVNIFDLNHHLRHVKDCSKRLRR